jgi:hypothetical protein
VNGCDRAPDAVGAAPGLAEDLPLLEAGEGAFARCSQPGMVPVVLLVVLGAFVAAVLGGADSGAGALVGAVGQDEELTGQAGVDHTVCAGCGEVVRAAGQRSRES